MTTDETYNGYTNRETWAVALHIDNDQSWLESVHDDLQDAKSAREETAGALHAYQAGLVVQENVEQAVFGDHADGSLQTDLVQHTLARVDWTELGGVYLTSLAEDSLI